MGSCMTPRAAALAAYIARERWWLDDYALFQAIARRRGHGATGATGRAPLRDREPRRSTRRGASFAREVLRQQYLQWIAEAQWQAARAAARARGVPIFGDLPFVVATDSADVWARRDEFMLDVSARRAARRVQRHRPGLGAADVPLGRHRRHRLSRGCASARGAWPRSSTAFASITWSGFYRTFGRPPEGEPFFNPADEPTQTRQGEAILRIFLETGAEIIAEDLGDGAADFVRASLARLGVPGCKVLRWERDWHAPGQPFVDPRDYPPLSVAMTGTHDTETRSRTGGTTRPTTSAARCSRCRSSGSSAVDDVHAPGPKRCATRCWTSPIDPARTTSSCPLQDVFGWRDRINMPGTVGDTTGRGGCRGRSIRSTTRAGGRRTRRVLPSAGELAPAAREPLEWRATLIVPHGSEPLPHSRVPAAAGRARNRATSRSTSTSFRERKTAAEILQRLEGRRVQILMAEAPLPDDPSTVVPVSYKVSHELRAEETDPKLADLVGRLADAVEFRGRRILYNWLGATRLDWRGQGHFRALTEEQEVWAVAQGYDEVVVKTKNRYYDMRGTLDSLQFNVIKLEPAADPLESKVYLSKRLGPCVLDAHRSRRQVLRA